MSRRLDIIIFGAAFLFSLFAHVVLIEGLGNAARKAPRKRYRPMEVAVLAPPPPPPPVEEKKPEPKKKPPPPPPPEPVEIKNLEVAPPPPNTDEVQTKKEPPKPVFGISMSSVVGPGTGAGFTVRVGNTLMKDPEEEFTKPEDVKAYAKPASMHQVSKLPRKSGECQAVYPAQAKSMQIEGAIRLEVEIGADGIVRQVRVLKGLGYGLDEAAMAALRKCRFEPAIMGGRPVATRIPYTYRFILED